MVKKSSARSKKSARVQRALGLLAVIALGWLAVESAIWPDVARLAEQRPEATAFMRRYEKRSGRPARQEWVEYGRISGELKRAVLVAEDIDFFSHDGFAKGEMRAAIEEAVRARRIPRGASTITQQLAKNLWLSPARTPRRKVREALLARALEEHLSKRRILEIYLNVVEFGDDTFGCEAASRHFFGKRAADLDAHEAARLAAVLPRPSSWSPLGNGKAFLEATRRIERRVQRARWLEQVI